MAKRTESERDGGQGFHVADCYIWAEIYYLDSPTDYREYLPRQVSPVQSNPGNQHMVLLDDQPRPGFLTSFAKFLFYCLAMALAALLVIALEWD